MIVGNRRWQRRGGDLRGDSPNADVLVARERGLRQRRSSASSSATRRMGTWWATACTATASARSCSTRRQRGRRLALHREQGHRQQQASARQCGGANGRELGHRNSDRRRADNRIYGNYIRDNTPSGAVDFAGGVVVADIGIPGANPPSGNVVKRNVILGNQPDILWDGSGSGNVFDDNLCRTSVPDGLCDSWHSGHHREAGTRPVERADRREPRCPGDSLRRRRSTSSVNADKRNTLPRSALLLRASSTRSVGDLDSRTPSSAGGRGQRRDAAGDCPWRSAARRSSSLARSRSSLVPPPGRPGAGLRRGRA